MLIMVRGWPLGHINMEFQHSKPHHPLPAQGPAGGLDQFFLHPLSVALACLKTNNGNETDVSGASLVL